MTRRLEILIQKLITIDGDDSEKLIQDISYLVGRYDTEQVYVSQVKSKNKGHYFEVKTYFRGKQQYLGRKPNKKEAEKLKSDYEKSIRTITVESRLQTL